MEANLDNMALMLGGEGEIKPVAGGRLSVFFPRNAWQQGESDKGVVYERITSPKSRNRVRAT